MIRTRGLRWAAPIRSGLGASTCQLPPVSPPTFLPIPISPPHLPACLVSPVQLPTCQCLTSLLAYLFSLTCPTPYLSLYHLPTWLPVWSHPHLSTPSFLRPQKCSKPEPTSCVLNTNTSSLLQSPLTQRPRLRLCFSSMEPSDHLGWGPLHMGWAAAEEVRDKRSLSWSRFFAATLLPSSVRT